MRLTKLVLLLYLIFQFQNDAISQSNIKIGEQAPSIEIGEWIENVPKSKKLKGKFIVLDFWASWCQPCLEAVPELNKLRKAYPNDNLLFLAMTNDSKQVAKKVLAEVDFQTTVVLDKNKQTHINFGDGISDLAYYPMTVLIDDKNIIRWYGSSSNLTAEMIEKLLKSQNMYETQLSLDGPYAIEQDQELLLEREFSREKWSDMFMDPTIIERNYIEEVPNSTEKSGPYFKMGAGMGTGAFFELSSLKEILNFLFPDKQFQMDQELECKKYRFYFIDKNLNSDSDEKLISQIAEQLSLSMNIKEVDGKKQIVSIDDDRLLIEGNKKSRGIRKGEDQVLIFTKTTIEELVNKLSLSTNHLWKYNGKLRKKFYFEIDMSSLATIKSSLTCYGLVVKEKPQKMELIELLK